MTSRRVLALLCSHKPEAGSLSPVQPPSKLAPALTPLGVPVWEYLYFLKSTAFPQHAVQPQEEGVGIGLWPSNSPFLSDSPDPWANLALQELFLHHANPRFPPAHCLLKDELSTGACGSP